MDIFLGYRQMLHQEKGIKNPYIYNKKAVKIRQINSLLILSLFLFTRIHDICAQTREEKYLLKLKESSIGISFYSTVDPYLSPLTYNGSGLCYEYFSSKLLSSNKTRLSSFNQMEITGVRLKNPPKTGEMLFAKTNYGYGINYQLSKINNLKIFSGGYADFCFGIKYLPRNINNPMNIDLATNLNISFRLIYTTSLYNFPIKLKANIRSPILGYMFVPEQGASYYDIFVMGSMDQIFHFSSLGNKLGLNQRYSIDFSLKRNTFHLGFDYNLLRYKANKMVFIQNNFNVFLGISYQTIRFAGRKTKIPLNFLSVE